MASISLNLSGTLTRSSGSFSNGPDTETGHGSTVQAEASCSVNYNSTGKYYTIGTVYLKLKGQPSGTSVTISDAYPADKSGNGSSFKFNPSKSSGTMTLTGTSYTSITYSSSTVSVSDTYTNKYKNAKAQLTFLFKIQTTEGTEYYVIYINLDFYLYGGKPVEYRITYKENSDFGGAQIASYTYNEGSKITIRSAYSRTLSAQIISIGVSFNTLGGVPQPDYRDKSTTQSRKYIFESWSGYSPGSSLTVNRDYNFIEEYDINYGEINGKTIGSLPPVNKKGYLKTNVGFDQNGAQVDASTQVIENLTLRPQWDPVTYTVKFDLNGGKLDPNDGRISDYSFLKTYGIGYQLPSIVPLRLGYTFDGGSNQEGTINPQSAGTMMDDRVYNSIYTDYSSGPVTLYAKGVLKPNTVGFDYGYNTQDSDPSHDVHIYKDNPSATGREYAQYNITQSIFEYGQPVKGTRTGDYVFLGGSDVLPDEYNDPTKVNQGYHGVYNVPPNEIKTQSGEISSIDLPIEIKPSDYKTYADGGIDETYYGIWAKTGKYIKIGNNFKKVNTMYAKIAGKWCKIIDAGTCIKSAEYDDQGNLIQEAIWKHEI